MQWGGERDLEHKDTDIEIIDKCTKGDHEAFAEIVSRYKNLIYSVAVNMVEDRQEVNDVVQEVFLRIYKSLYQYNPEYKFSTWAVKITTNICINKMKRKKASVVSLEDIQELHSGLASPETELLNVEQSKYIHEALKALPEKYRTPLILFHQNGLTYEDLTKVLKVPMSIIKNRLHRGRLMLRERLQADRKEGIL